MGMSLRRKSKNKPNHDATSFAAAQDGVTMLEFAMAFPVFLFFFFGLMEIGLITFGNASIDNMMNQSARAAMIGCHRNEVIGRSCDPTLAVTPARIRREIREKSYYLVDACNRERFTLSVAPVDDFNFSDPDDSVVNLGQGNEVVVYYARYRWPTFSPYLDVRELFGSFVDYEYATVVRNERFGSMGTDRIYDGGECA
jgi:hypothetical protein